MEVRSLAGLTQLVERVEALATQLRGLSGTESEVQVPDVPLPLSLQSTESWLRTMEEYRRRPRLARSKQLLEAHGIDTGPIPAAVLEDSDALSELFQKIDPFPTVIRAASVKALAAALTKGVDDATNVLEQFSEAMDAIGDLETRSAAHPWVYELVAKSIAASPTDASDIAEEADAILQHAIAASQHGVTIGTFETLSDALGALSAFTGGLAERNRYSIDEGLSQNSNDLKGHDLHTATSTLEQSLERLQNEKKQLAQQASDLLSQLDALGRTVDIEASTLAELRGRVPELRTALEERRRVLRESLGKDVYQVVQTLAEGQVPPAARVDDANLGRAVRKAIDCGYQIRLEVPRED